MSEMLELGTLLREERERKGLTLEELSERIKLAPRTLAFIESGTKSELPHAVYVKGFVKSYASLVGLDPEEVGAMVDSAYKEEMEEDVAEPIISERNKKGGFPVKAVLLIVLLVALGAGGYVFMTSGSSLLNTADVAQQAAPAVSSEPAATQEAVVVETPVEPVQSSDDAVSQPEKVVEEAPVEEAVVEPAVEEPVAATEQPVEKSNAVEKKNKPVAVVPVVAPADIVEAEKAAANELVAVKRSLRIEATADCWVEASGEGFGRKEFLLRSGQSHTVSFPQDLAVRLGNSGGITLTLDGKPYAFEGKDGRVRTVRIAAS